MSECALKIALTRSIFQPKMHQISFGGRVPPGPAGGAYSAPPDALAGLRGLYFYGRGKGEEGWEGKGRKGMEEKGEGRVKERERRNGKRGRGGEGRVVPPHDLFARRPCSPALQHCDLVIPSYAQNTSRIEFT